MQLELVPPPQTVAHLHHRILEILILEPEQLGRLGPVKYVRRLGQFVVRIRFADGDVLEIRVMFVQDLAMHITDQFPGLGISRKHIRFRQTHVAVVLSPETTGTADESLSGGCLLSKSVNVRDRDWRMISALGLDRKRGIRRRLTAVHVDPIATRFREV